MQLQCRCNFSDGGGFAFEVQLSITEKGQCAVAYGLSCKKDCHELHTAERFFSDGFGRGGGFGNPNRVCCAGCFLNRLRALKAACIFELR